MPIQTPHRRKRISGGSGRKTTKCVRCNRKLKGPYTKAFDGPRCYWCRPR